MFIYQGRRERGAGGHQLTVVKSENIKFLHMKNM